MGFTFWFGLVLGILGSLVASFIANYFNPQFADLMHRGRTSFIERSKKRAIRQFKLIIGMRSGKPDRYLFVITKLGYALIHMIFVSMLVILVAVLGNLESLSVFTLTALLLCGVISFSRMIILFSMVELISARLEDFEGYKAEFVARWGSSAVELDCQPVSPAPQRRDSSARLENKAIASGTNVPLI